MLERVTRQNLKNCPSFPNEEEYLLHIEALSDDISMIKGVSSVNWLPIENAFVVTVETSQKVFLEQLEPFLIRDFCWFRYKNIEAFL